MKNGAAEPYHEFPAKATGNNRFDATLISMTGMRQLN